MLSRSIQTRVRKVKSFYVYSMIERISTTITTTTIPTPILALTRK